MPSIEQRRKSFSFRLLAPLLKATPENDYHWIFHAIIRTSFLVAAVPGVFTAVRLSGVETLTPEIVNDALRTMSLVTAAPILLLIVPYYILKTIRVVGFSRIDYKRPFPLKKTFKAPSWWHDRKKLIRKQFFVMIFLIITVVFQWTSLRVFMEHFGVLTDIDGVYFFILLSFFIGSPSLSSTIFLLSMTCLQYKYHYHEIAHLLTENRQGE